ncbi:MAG: phosphoenolpyruvate--protein phosphotransferase [Candidatus Aminicenantes bacterium]|nr:phosphoenolpyruvate--protein phosphotransferase [Candidatus Aminicenantes bacterium]MDH5383343.1 phosphoenolpyruvate--protein phosphotransferase [Candidatus Aminicenantes bacterium]MDH5745118.1 phosphoenolpyruvate--protein phosphotransferase [Candidatus Aminicenantes bacterium]
MDYVRLRGLGVSPGIAVGEVQLTEEVVFTTRKEIISPSQLDDELRRLTKAIERTRGELVQIKEDIKDKVGEEHAFIFEAHLSILEDKSLFSSLTAIIKKEKTRAEWAISRVHDKYQRLFEAIDDEYLMQRKFDVADVLSRIYRNLEPTNLGKRDDGKEKIIVAHELLPSEAAMRLSKGNVLAVALDMGGQTSHTAILARSLNIPAVVGLRNISQRVKNGDILIVDGTDGEVLINPPLAIKKEFASKRQKYDDYRKELRKIAKLSSKTLDRHTFSPLANIELPEEVAMAFSMGAEGIGLFRSEFIYLQSTSLPSEEDHFQIYSQIAKGSYPAPVYIRTVDVGGEKNMPQFKIEKEPNPALGLRAIRFSLKDRELFKIQLKSILRASTLKNVKILIPMITELEEIEEVKMLFRTVKQELKGKGTPFDENIALGVMIEVPAAAALTDILVKEVDYISIGTNDLIQYYLAVDRSNELVSYLFKPLHPSVLRLIKFIIETAQREKKEVTVCGEMAADPLSAIVLLGLGLRKFSMNPIFIPRIKNVLRSVEYKTAREVVREALMLRTAQEIEECVIERILFRHPKAFLMG